MAHRDIPAPLLQPTSTAHALVLPSWLPLTPTTRAACDCVGLACACADRYPLIDGVIAPGPEGPTLETPFDGTLYDLKTGALHWPRTAFAVSLSAWCMVRCNDLKTGALARVASAWSMH
jgi:hypothetical protein